MGKYLNLSSIKEYYGKVFESSLKGNIGKYLNLSSIKEIWESI